MMKTLLLVGILSLVACSPYYGYRTSNGQPDTATAPNTGSAPNASVAGSSSSSGTYIVQPGDTLYSISRRFGISQQLLMEKNRITNPGQLTVGQQLNL